MSDTVAAEAALAAHAHHEELGFLRTYVFSTDHKMIGRQFLFLGLFMLLIGGTLAMMVRWELAWPETAVPGFNWIPEPYMYEGIIPPQTYNALFTMHATLMILAAEVVAPPRSSALCHLQTHATQQATFTGLRYSITSSARASSVGGSVSPSALAVLRLITSSYLEACSTGRSAGLAPLRILST